jgi:hypothetical protein
MRRALAAVVVVVSACSSTTAEPSSTTASPTTTAIVAPSTTTSTSAQPSTTTIETPETPATDIVSSNACTPSPSTTQYVAGYKEAALDHFGPLGASPKLVIDVPSVAADQPTIQVARIVGGVLVGVSSFGPSTNFSMLAAVNSDGSKNWVTCPAGPITGIWAAPPATGGAASAFAVVAVLTQQTATRVFTDWEVVRLGDGSTGTGLQNAAREFGRFTAEEFATSRVVASTPTRLLFAHMSDEGSVNTTDHLAMFDMVTQKVSEVPVPSEVTNPSIGELDFAFSEQGDPIVQHHGFGSVVVAAYHGGAWTDDPTILRATRGTQLWFGADAPFAMVGLDPTGVTRWTRPALTSPFYPGSGGTTEGSVAVATASLSPSDVSSPASPSLVAVDATTGKLLWSAPGCRYQLALADGYLLTNDGEAGCVGAGPAGWVLLNARTGRLADASQHWTDPHTFPGCCGDTGESLVRSGGVLIVATPSTISVWYPKSVGGPTHTVSLP